MATITDFDEWLEEAVDGDDYNDVYNLYQTISEEVNYGGFEISINNGRWFLKSGNCDDTLMISTENARDTLLNIIEDRYCEDMGIEGYYAFHHGMENDN